MATYSHPEVLVSTQWVSEHIKDPQLRLVEVDVDTSAYDQGHIEGAVGWNWQTQLCDQIRRDLIPKGQLEKIMGESGIGNQTAVVLYGDNNNWFAAWALWQLKIYGHQEVRLMNGGRKKWIAEGRDLVKEVAKNTRTTYQAKDPDWSIRSYLPEVMKAVENRAVQLVDVRSPQEYTGEILAPPGLPETCQRGGHVPTAKNIPWGKACNDDGTFKSVEELKTLYTSAGITGEKPVIAYCRIGERSSHTWFVLKYLLGYHNVKNYDGSWTEWGNLVGASVEKP
ncbi:MAG: sulfurtransferase [Nitrospiria bacterium]